MATGLAQINGARIGTRLQGLGGALALFVSLIPNGGCVPECLFVDQSENEMSLVVASSGEVSVVSGSFPEGAWICGGLVLPPGPLERRPKHRPHRPIPPGDWTLEALAEGITEKSHPHHPPTPPPGAESLDSDGRRGRDTEEETW